MYDTHIEKSNSNQIIYESFLFQNFENYFMIYDFFDLLLNATFFIKFDVSAFFIMHGSVSDEKYDVGNKIYLK